MRILLFAAAAMSLAASSAFAQSSEGASFTPLTTIPAQLIKEGAVWRCDGASCRAAKVRGVPALHACKRLVGDVGAVSAFTWRGRTLDPAELMDCNASAKIEPKAVAKR